MESQELRTKLKEDPKLAKSLEEAFEKNASEEEITGILSDAGIDSEAAEELLAEFQHRRGVAIGFEDIDAEALTTVAGGSIAGGCTNNYYKQNCSSTVESDDWCWANDICWALWNVYACTRSSKEAY